MFLVCNICANCEIKYLLLNYFNVANSHFPSFIVLFLIFFSVSCRYYYTVIMVSVSFVLQMNLPFDDLHFHSFKIENRFSSPAVHPDHSFLAPLLTANSYHSSLPDPIPICFFSEKNRLPRHSSQT